MTQGMHVSAGQAERDFRPAPRLGPHPLIRVVGEGGDDAEREVDVLTCRSEGKGSSQVLARRVETTSGIELVRRLVPGSKGLDECRVVLRMTNGSALDLSPRSQLLQPVLTQGLEHPERSDPASR